MGLFDKVKHLAGGHGVTVTVTEIERQPPEGATLPLHDSILKGRIQVSGEKEVVVLKHVFRLTAIRETDGEYQEAVLDESVNEGEIIGAEYSWPYTLNPGQTVDDSFLVGPFDIPAAMAEMGLEAEAAMEDPAVRIELKVIADVKGTPLDAAAKLPVTIVPGGGEASYEDEDAGDGLPDIPARTEALPLDPRPYRARFQEMIAGLEADARFEVTTAELRDPAPAADVEALAAEHHLPEAMRRLYGEMDGLKVEWHLKDDEQICGAMDLLPLAEVCGSWEDNLWFEDYAEDYEKQMHAFDYFVAEGCCAISLDGSDDPQVYFKGDEFEALQLTFAAYLELLLKSRGFWYWPMAISADLTGEEYTVEPGNFRRWMPRLFDDYQGGFFLRRSYDDQDQAADDERSSQVDEVRAALDAQGAEYRIADGESGYIDIAVVDTADNLAKVGAAMEAMGMGADFAGDWGAMSISRYMFEKVASL